MVPVSLEGSGSMAVMESGDRGLGWLPELLLPVALLFPELLFRVEDPLLSVGWSSEFCMGFRILAPSGLVAHDLGAWSSELLKNLEGW